MGGTFDPVHHGHLLAAEVVRCHYGLELVVFVPAAISPAKRDARPADGFHRLIMLYLATLSNPGFEVSAYELEREGPSYTVDTIRTFREQEPEAQIYFITGADAALSLPSWQSPEELLSMARFIAVSRPGFSHQSLEQVMQAFPGNLRDRLEVFDIPVVGVSSSEIRRRVRNGNTIKYMVPESVENYIVREKLYLT